MSPRSCKEIIRDLVSEMVKLDQTLGRSLPEGEVTVVGPAQALVFGTLLNTRRTFGSVCALFERGVVGDTDHKEDAAVLLRKMMNSLAHVFFVVDLAEDPDINAIRSERTDLIQQRTAIRDILRIQESEERQRQAEEQQRLIDWTESLLTSAGITDPQTPRLPITAIFEKIDPNWMIRWRYESDVAHSGVVGRALQRQGITLGVSASPHRTANVIALAIGIITTMVGRWFQLRGEEDPDLTAFVREQAYRVEGLETEAQSCD